MLYQNITNNSCINQALELYHKYCSDKTTYPDQIHTITKALQLDSSSFTAVLLHENIQHLNLEDYNHFNNNIIYLVDVINKLSTIHYKPYAEQYIHFHELLLTINPKLQETAILTSLVPLLHKVSIFNLEYNNTNAQHISEIITNCYIPYLLSYTAHNDLAYLLQDLCFKIQYPEERNRILHYMYWLYPDIDNIIHNIEQQFGNIFRKLNIKASLSYRIKSPYSIWIKTLVKDIHITALNDILAFRAIVPNKKACYDVSKLIHLHYNTITSQFVDYIRYPKNNGYQSIHIVISDSNKGNIELQIRSTTMHRQTQYGSAHHTYKVNKYYVSRTNNNVSVVLFNITLSYSNRILSVYVSIVTITSTINNNLYTYYNTIPSFTQYTQHSTDFVGNDITTCTLSRTTTPEYITYYNNNLSLLIKDTNTIPYNFSLNINLNLSNTVEYKLVPLAVVQIPASNLLFEHNSVFINITYKPILAECAFPATITYTKRHEDSNIRSIFKPPSPKTDIINATYNTLLATINDKVVLEQYGQKEFLSTTINTNITQMLPIITLLVDPSELNKRINDISDSNKDQLLRLGLQLGCVESVPLLITHGANPNATNCHGVISLHCAAKNGNLDLAKLLAKNGADVNAKTDRIETPLHYAVKSGNLYLVKWLIENQANIHAKTDNGETVLHYAVSFDNSDLVYLLIAYGADVNAKTDNGLTALHYAVYDGNLDLVSLLISHGADVNAKTNSGETILYSAVDYGSPDLVYLLIAYGADVNAKTDNGETALHYAVESGNLDLVSLLIHNGANVNNAKTILHFAVKSGNLNLVNWLIKNKADIHAKTNSGETILHFAAESGNLNLVNWLIKNKADIHAKTNSGETILHFAVALGSLDLVSLLIHNGTDINTKTDDGLTALHYAVESGNLNLVSLLIHKGIDVNAKTNSGETILHFAVALGSLDLVSLLMVRGADVNAKTDDGLTALHYAVESDNLALVSLLMVYGADVNAKNNSGETPLHYAVIFDSLDLVSLLIHNGADVNTKNNSGETVLNSIMEFNNCNILKSFILGGADINLETMLPDDQTDSIINLCGDLRIS
ncbi:ankyrin repeat domain-containing protein [Rickettsia rhipicephali]|uniref:ankyrin repeat domain-containing protein n=1 Tax=Rickettsia rhipicephali TaxID=33992 RepID=UPI0022531450|nr:ankyrin repeat domain-containing protein [Rickettsia rhipicephali]MCX4079769.1 ankyrin repeat domain-containing protein [Rickettsia rhipicephali]